MQKFAPSREVLQVLDAINSRGSFADAAELRERIPSGISYQVQKLEEQLGVTLFQRRGRRSVLSSAGRLLLEEGRQLLAAAAQLENGTREVATGWEPRLRLALETIKTPARCFR